MSALFAAAEIEGNLVDAGLKGGLLGGVRLCGSRDGAELLKQAQIVVDTPGFGDFAIGKANDVDSRHRDRPARCRNAEELSCLRPAHGEALRDSVFFSGSSATVTCRSGKACRNPATAAL